MLTWHLVEPRPPIPIPSDLSAPDLIVLMHRDSAPVFTEREGATFFGAPDAKSFRRGQMQHRRTLRLAALPGDELVGWSFGFADRPDDLDMALRRGARYSPSRSPSLPFESRRCWRARA